MAQQQEKRGNTGARLLARTVNWLKHWWRYLNAHENSDLAAWQTTLLGRRKLTHPAEVTKMRQPVRANPRATWYR